MKMSIEDVLTLAISGLKNGKVQAVMGLLEDTIKQVPKTIPDVLYKQTLVLLTFAVHEHVVDNGTNGRPIKADPGWRDAYETMEAFEAL